MIENIKHKSMCRIKATPAVFFHLMEQTHPHFFDNFTHSWMSST